MNPSRLLDGLDYRFRDAGLLHTALTHRSYGANHNERMEFLGDAVLNCVIAMALYARFPQLPEGELSRLRAHLVRQDSLHRLAVRLNLGEYLALGEGELKSGGAGRPSMLADALEAIFGAINLDGGFDAARRVIERLYADDLAELVPGKDLKDAKTRLQEWLQGRRKPLPKYIVLDTSGLAHAQQFQVACEIDAFGIRALGTGSSRRIAEQMAAENALKELEV